ncbi:hypothetical protein DB032_19475 [Chromobacterium sp. Panama]|uniref:ATP-binding protein n=1 Tax=Chromobacterium sp. Panama TaxID=2161826 RepID=UPI000D2FCE8E|nr:ATP-binding protein [Chromobacterium sp. Panama]PTU66947.1 hypothetical protein DB032_19475 [Chromobacterium sp. Panama]
MPRYLLIFTQGILLTAVSLAVPIERLLNEKEVKWAQAHPITQANTISTHHQDSIEAELTELIRQKTGLSLKLSELTHPLASLPNNQLPTVIIGADLRAESDSFIHTHYVATFPYNPLVRVFVTRNTHGLIPSIRTIPLQKMGLLNNSYLPPHYKNTLKIKRFSNQKQLLQAVTNGSIDVALLLREDAIFELPNYHTLVIAGYEEETSAQTLLVRKDNPILYSILNKTIQNFTARELFNTTLLWQEHTNQNIPELKNIWKGYHWTLLAAIAILSVMTIALVFSRKAYQAKKESDEVKSKFLAMMSHELRTPLGVILTANELLQDTHLSTNQKKLLQQAQSAGNNLMELFNNVLDISRIEAHQIELEARPTSIALLLQELHDQYLPLANEKKISLLLTLNQIPPALLIDDIRLKQAVRNLISNAIKFTEQGFIEIMAESNSCTSLINQKNQICIQISDSGIGIPVNRQAALFQPFVQADASTTRRYGGSGLGLSICKEIIELMGGTITLVSKEGQGSQFTLSFPATICQERVAPLVASGPRAEIPGHALILLVEDHIANQEMIATQVRSLGLRCQIVGDGLQALHTLAHDEEIDLILMDCHLPLMDGYQAAERIRIQEQLLGKKRRPIIAISANTGDAHRKHCLESGMDDVLSKPLQLASLQTLLWMWLPSLSSPPKQASQPVSAPEEASLWQAFINCNEEDYDQAAQAIARGDWQTAHHHVHRIKGASRTMQTQQIAAAADALESAIGQQESECGNLLQALRQALDHFTPPLS